MGGGEAAGGIVFGLEGETELNGVWGGRLVLAVGGEFGLEFGDKGGESGKLGEGDGEGSWCGGGVMIGEDVLVWGGDEPFA